MTPDTLQSYRQTLDLYLQHRGKALSHTTRRELLAALCSDRGALNFSGRHDLIGPEEKEVCTLLSPLDLQLVVQSLAVENLQARVLSFVVLSEENGGDISLLEPLEEQEAVLAEGKALLWERHEIECQLEGVWWLAQCADLHGVLAATVADCQQRVTALDVLWKEHIEHFLPLNAYRRSYRDILPRDRDFWWWTLLADCDIAAVYQTAEGKSQPSTHLQHCQYCQKLLASLQQTNDLLAHAKGQPLSHPPPGDLIRFYSGELREQEEAGLEWHLRLCERCRWEFAAIQRAVEQDSFEPGELVGSARRAMLHKKQAVISHWRSRSDSILAVAAASEGQGGVSGLPGEILYEDDDIEVWLNEEGGRVILRVYGQNLAALGLVEVSEPATGEVRTAPVTKGPTMLEFLLGTAYELRGKKLLLSLHKNPDTVDISLDCGGTEEQA